MTLLLILSSGYSSSSSEFCSFSFSFSLSFWWTFVRVLRLMYHSWDKIWHHWFGFHKMGKILPKIPLVFNFFRFLGRLGSTQLHLNLALLCQLCPLSVASSTASSRTAVFPGRVSRKESLSCTFCSPCHFKISFEKLYSPLSGIALGTSSASSRNNIVDRFVTSFVLILLRSRRAFRRLL